MPRRIALGIACALATILLAGTAAADGDAALEAEINRLLDSPAYRQARLLDSAATADVAVIVAGGERFGMLAVLEREGDAWAVTLENMLAVRQESPSEPGNPQVAVDMPEAGSARIHLSYAWEGNAAEYAFVKELGEWVLESGRVGQDPLTETVLYRRDERVRVENCCGGINAPASPGERLAQFDVQRAAVLYSNISRSILNQKQWGLSLPGGTTVAQPAAEGVRVRQGPGDAYALAEAFGGLLPPDLPYAVYGQEADWLMVAYAAEAGMLCYGYVEAAAVQQQALPLALADESVLLKAGTGLRTSPEDESAARVLEEKTPGVFLALYGGVLAYVQTQWKGETVRAFVPVDSLIRGEE